jgi:hypothetical protein
VVAPAVLFLALIALWWWADPAQPERTAVSAAAVYLLVTTPNYSWYALILIALIAASGRLEWLWLAFAPGLQYMSAEVHWDPHLVAVCGYGAALALALGWWVVLNTRRRLAMPPDQAAPAAGAAARDRTSHRPG